MEFLYSCIKQTIYEDLPKEAEFLYRYDTFKTQIEAFLEMPASMIDLLFHFLKQNNGILSKRARNHEFLQLTPEEITMIEALYHRLFIEASADNPLK